MSEFDPVSYIMGTKSGSGGGGGSSGGFTLLHGTYSVVDNAETVTLPITASALYALMQTSSVAFDYTSNEDGYSVSGMVSFTEAKLIQEEGYADQYLLVAAEYSGWFGATDAVVITLSGGK